MRECVSIVEPSTRPHCQRGASIISSVAVQTPVRSEQTAAEPIFGDGPAAIEVLEMNSLGETVERERPFRSAVPH